MPNYLSLLLAASRSRLQEAHSNYALAGYDSQLTRSAAVCLCLVALLCPQAPKAAPAPTNGTGPSVAPSDATGSHHALLLSMLADELGCKPTDIGVSPT